uniref:39S ribosomal protein L41-like n=1 Tax=Rhizophora mucronata TaxID=61149 RepID=A0A2P2K5U5_RHIMU
MPLGLILGIGRATFRRKRTSSLGILSSKRAPRDYYKGKNCKPTGFHTRKGLHLRFLAFYGYASASLRTLSVCLNVLCWS